MEQWNTFDEKVRGTLAEMKTDERRRRRRAKEAFRPFISEKMDQNNDDY